MLNQREITLGDAMTAEAGGHSPQLRLIAASLASVHRVLYAEASRQSGRQAAEEDLRRLGAGGHAGL
jgi:hypothetical protein